MDIFKRVAQHNFLLHEKVLSQNMVILKIIHFEYLSQEEEKPTKIDQIF